MSRRRSRPARALHGRPVWPAPWRPSAAASPPTAPTALVPVHAARRSGACYSGGPPTLVSEVLPCRLVFVTGQIHIRLFVGGASPALDYCKALCRSVSPEKRAQLLQWLQDG